MLGELARGPAKAVQHAPGTGKTETILLAVFRAGRCSAGSLGTADHVRRAAPRLPRQARLSFMLDEFGVLKKESFKLAPMRAAAAATLAGGACGRRHSRSQTFRARRRGVGRGPARNVQTGLVITPDSPIGPLQRGQVLILNYAVDLEEQFWDRAWRPEPSPTGGT